MGNARTDSKPKIDRRLKTEARITQMSILLAESEKMEPITNPAIQLNARCSVVTLQQKVGKRKNKTLSKERNLL